MREYKEVLGRLRKDIEHKFSQAEIPPNQDTTSLSFRTFKQEQKEEFSLNTTYEKYCAFSAKFLGFISFGKKTEESLHDEIEIAGINVTPRGVIASAFMTQLISLLIGFPFLFLGFLNFAFFIVCTGAFLGAVSYTYPGFRSELTKINAQQESLLAILYMTIYMRVNPILENAMYFASQHLKGPIGKDLKQCLWLVDNEKVGSLEEAIQYFIPLWVKRNVDFVKSLLILYSVLEQTSKENQIKILDKALDTILQSTYERMKHYSHDLQIPVTVLHTFGLMLPLVGLIAFPMLSIFMADSIRISYLFFGYIIVLPMLLFFFIRRVISKRPGAFSYPDISNNPYVPPQGMYKLKLRDKTYLVPVLSVALAIALLIVLPGVNHIFFSTLPTYLKMREKDFPEEVIIPEGMENELTIQSILLTLTIPLGLAVGVALFFYGRSVQRMKVREDVVEIEEDLPGALFQFSNQFTEKIPIEQAVENFVNEYVLLNLKKRSIFLFFSAILDRIQDEGVTFAQAIFDKKGVIIRYPSVLLREIAWIISEGERKGAQIVFNIVNKISIYLDNLKKIKELIYDLLAEVVSSINMQARFLAPFIAGIVGSLTTVIIRALVEMAKKLSSIMGLLRIGTSGVRDSNFFSGFIEFSQIIPPTMFQVLVGIYMVETVFLLSFLANGVENGFDAVSRDMTIARNMTMAIIVYVLISVVSTLALTSLVGRGTAMT
ncbi:hypothetical protein JW930_00170 [Candidatus Woesearchaeota archaeon]|nr:hypothetical protein [Candidatus Woesearchaeota archaeon]